MPVLLITYDVKNAYRKEIDDYLKGYPVGRELNESTYAVVTEKTPQDVHADLTKLANPTWAGSMEKEALDWLYENLSR